MKQLRSVSHNNIHITGFLVKDAYVNPTGTMAAFRIAHSLGRDRKGLFFGCVIFGTAENPLPTELLKKGDKSVVLDIEGHLRTKEVTRKDGTKFDDLELVVDKIGEAETKEVEVTETAAPADAPEDLPEGVTDDLPLGPDEQ